MSKESTEAFGFNAVTLAAASAQEGKGCGASSGDIGTVSKAAKVPNLAGI